jgi:hypothetical protein
LLALRAGKDVAEVSGTTIMVERRTELNRRYHRKKKMGKLKARLAAAKSHSEREAILKKIHAISPFWQEPTPQG